MNIEYGDMIRMTDNMESLSMRQVFECVRDLCQNIHDRIHGEAVCDKLVNLLIGRCHLSPDKITWLDNESLGMKLYGIESIADECLLYAMDRVIGYYLLYCSDGDKLRQVLDDEFKKDEISFFVGLYHNIERLSQYEPIEKVLPGLPKSIKDHPYFQILSYPTSYSRAAKAYIFPSSCLYDKLIVPHDDIVAMIPKTKHFTLADKIRILLYDIKTSWYYDKYTTLSEIMTETPKHKINHMFLIKLMSMPVLHKYMMKINDYKTSKKILRWGYFISSRRDHNNMTIWSSNHVEYVRYLIGKIISDNGMRKFYYHTFGTDVRRNRAKWLIKHDMVDNELFRYLCKRYRPYIYHNPKSGIGMINNYFRIKDS